MSNKSDLFEVGIAGYGVVGKRRRIHIDEHPNLKTVAVSDQFYKTHGTLEHGITYHPDYRYLLDQNLDILFVCLPNYLAADVTMMGLEAGCHVFCEKPPACTLEDMQRVMSVERKHPDLRLKYGFNHRYHASVKDALGMIQSGEIGEIINVRGVYGKSKIIPFSGGWRAERKYSGGGILLDQGIHMVDLLQLFCGEFTEVKSFVSNNFWRHDVEDNAYAIMKDRHDRIAMLHSSATKWQHRFLLDVSLSGGFIELRGILSGSKSYGQETLVFGKRDESDVGTQREETLTYLEDSSWKEEIDEFAESILEGKPVRNGSSADALSTMKTVFRIYHADSQWRDKHHILNPDHHY